MVMMVIIVIIVRASEETQSTIQNDQMNVNKHAIHNQC